MPVTAGSGADLGELDALATALLRALDQRYTTSRRALVRALAEAGRPLTMSEVVARVEGTPQSSAYRNLTVLCEAGVARRLPGVDDLGRFELAEDLAGHHHHAVCASCGTVVDFEAPSRLERLLVEAAKLVTAETGYEITSHRLDFEGRCPRCGGSPPSGTAAVT
jgi:Fe2+ or Zn2+ uptake regulation protein